MLGFRVWDSKDKVFYKHPSWGISQDGDLMWGDCASNTLCDSCDDRYVPMQSTGLKDCKGIEIFEGDVLQVLVDYNPDRVAYVLVESTYQIYNILMGRYRNKLFTILENIYSSPELLEKCK